MLWSRNSVRRGLDLVAGLLIAALPAHADMAYVTCQNGEALSVFDLDQGVEIARWSLPGQPAGIAVSYKAVFTVAPMAKAVRRHDPMTGDVLAEVVLEGGPTGIALDTGRGHVFVSDWYNARIWVLDSVDLTVSQELSVGSAPAGLDVSEDGQLLASAERDANQVSFFDTETLALMGRVTVGERPYGLRFHKDGRLFVGNVGTNDISVIDTANMQVVGTIPVGERPYGVGFSGNLGFATNQYANTLSIFDTTTLEPIKEIDTNEYPEGIDTTSDGKIVIANWFDNTIQIIDPATQDITATLETADGPRAFGRFIRP